MAVKANATIDITALRVASANATGYITDITNNGIKVASATASNLNYVTIDATGMEIFKSNGASPSSSVSVAKFGETTRIGKDNTEHIELSSNAFEMKDSNGTSFFKIRDAVNETGEVIDTFTGDRHTKTFTLNYEAQNTSYTVTQNNEPVTPTKTTTTITFSVAPEIGDIIVVTYNVTGNAAKGYDIGIRRTGKITGIYSLIEGYDNIASGKYSHAEGQRTTASNTCSHAEGSFTYATGVYSHTEGNDTYATGECSHAEGQYSRATGFGSHAEGNYTTTESEYSHAEGKQTTASGYAAHAEGTSWATGSWAHAEGGFITNLNVIKRTVASGTSAHAEGQETTASGNAAHAEGLGTTASGNYTHAGGKYTNAGYEGQTVIGEYNKNKSVDLFEVGNGTGVADSARSNAFEVDDSGNANITGTYRKNGVEIPYITENGTKTGGWYYEKWSTGKVEAWGSVSTGTLPTMSGGNRVYMATGVNGSIPSGIFSSTPSFIEAFCHYSNAACYSVWASPTSSTAFKMQVVKNANNTTGIDVQIHAVYYPSTY